MTYKKYIGATALLLANLAVSGGANASNVWVGTADYSSAPGSDGSEDVVGPFDTFEFSLGANLLEISGSTVKGYFQSYLTDHKLNGVGLTNDSGLSQTGAPLPIPDGGYEVTVWAEYTGVITSGAPGGAVSFTITGGTMGLDFDTSPDYSFTSDTGFKNGTNGADGATILTGAVLSGTTGSVDATGFGSSKIQLRIGAANYDTTVFEPDTIAAGTGRFVLDILAGELGSVGSVLGVSATAGAGEIKVLQSADGYLTLATPIPAALWLFGSGLAGIAMVSRRRRETEEAPSGVLV
ncbi:MAG: flocculation-associated PEP-CTERM protein PepA [Gammaproteobacteria bacterium]|nr:flocculation-associated PEP-CTERM protein PepA [Gammaproteobacteria bacterium]